MASVVPLLKEICNLHIFTQTENEMDLEVIIKYFCAARCIQRWVRGYISRKHMLELHKAATIIQNFWRSVLARNQVRLLLEARIRENSLKYYDSKATLIQKTWRGHRVRRKIFHYYQLKEYLRFVGEENEKLLNRIEDYQFTSYNYERQKYEEAMVQKNKKTLQKLHHLLRTRVTPEVFSLHNQNDLSELEKLIASVKFPKRRRIIRDESKKQNIFRIGKLFQGPFPSC